MAAAMKAFYKSLKNLSKIFAAKEPDMEIGNPTDVKHVAHIGTDGSSGSTPSWMNEFKGSSDGEGRDPSTRSSKEPQARSDMPKDLPKKQKRKKSNPTSSPKSSSQLPRPRESRPAKHKSK